MELKISKGTIIRTAVLVLAIVNNFLAIFDKSPLPIDDAMLTNIISFIFTTGAALVAWWKNNSFSQAALSGDELMEELKERDN